MVGNYRDGRRILGKVPDTGSGTAMDAAITAGTQ